MQKPARRPILLKALVVLGLLVALLLIFNQSGKVNSQYQALLNTTPVPSLAPPSLAYREQALLLRSGSVGPEVIKLQQRLTQLGYYSGEADGKYYDGTQAAVKTFQLQNGLDADGLAGAKTLEALDSTAAKPYDPNFVTPTPPMPE